MDQLRFTRDWDEAQLHLAEFLLGYDGSVPQDWRMRNWEGSQRRLASPLRWYLGEVSRFTLDLGVRFNVVDAAEDSPIETLIQRVVKANRMTELVQLAIERGACTGAVYLFLKPDPERFYRLALYDHTEVMDYPEDWPDQGKMIQVPTEKGWRRWGVTDQEWVYYQDTKSPNSVWQEVKRDRHGYGFCPCVCVVNRINDHSEEPIPTFDGVSLELATEICSQVLSSSASHSFFGSPLLVSPDPEETLEQLQTRSRVLTGSLGTDLQAVDLIQGDAMPATHEGLLDKLGQEFCSHLGISWVPETPPGDTSSITLRTLFSKTVNHASHKAELYLNGFLDLLRLVRQAAPIDGVLYDTADDDLEWAYEGELFPMTPTEKQQVLAVVETLVGMGIRVEVALQEYYPQDTEDQIRERLLGS